MAVTCVGIDEAGYGPLLGPLGIVSVSAEAECHASLAKAFRRARTGIKDSKQIHTSGDIAAIERMALAAIAWATGSIPATAAECFALLGEGPAQRAGIPWMDGAEDIRLPVAAERIPRWRIEGATPAGVRGFLVQPDEFNRMLEQGNKADLELVFVGRLLRHIELAPSALVVVDRLGGRRYYGSFLSGLWPEATVTVCDEQAAASTYRVEHQGRSRAIGFHVDGEQESPLTAAASCIAKYARELHMLLLNRYWQAGVPGLRPTAGYPNDARRWLDDLGGVHIETHGRRLVRGAWEEEPESA